MEMYYGKPSGNSFEDILDQYSPSSINTLRTSTLPFLNYWKNTNERIASFLINIGNYSNAMAMNFEYPTPSYGSNKASMTDLMLFGQNFRIAIEAKFDEIGHNYESVSKWNKENTENRNNVLRHWLKILDTFTNERLSIDSVSEVPYQFIHRTASSCYENLHQAYTVYQVFYDLSTENKVKKFRQQLINATRILNPKSNLKVILVLISTELLIHNVRAEDALQKLKIADLYIFKEEEYVSSQKMMEN